MKPLATFMLLITLAASFGAQAQRKQRYPPPEPPRPMSEEEMAAIERNRECVYTERYTLNQRRKQFPFHRAHAVVLISFDKNKVKCSEWSDLLRHRIPLEKRKLVKDKTDEIVLLSRRGIDSLTDVLYNWRFRGPVDIMTFNQCFEPRNAILFVNRKGIVTDYYEICFECSRIRETNKKMHLGVQCEDHMEWIKQFFISQGIRIGTLYWEGQDNL